MASNNVNAPASHPSASRLILPLLLLMRLSLFVIYLLFGLLLALLIGAYFVQNKPWQQPFIRWYCIGVCRLLRVRITVAGTPPKGAALVVSNHISWLDIPVLFACLQDVSFLSKSEVRQWPLIGILGVAVGTLFIRRGGGEANTISRQIAEQLSRGRRVVVFPEGTTTVGNHVRPFHAKLFGSAMVGGTQIQPTLLHYRSSPAEPNVAPFVGDDDFRVHLCRILVSRPIYATVNWLPPIEVPPPTTDAAEDQDRWKAGRAELARAAHTRVSTALQQVQGECDA